MKVTLPLLAVTAVVSGSFMERRQVGVVNAAFADITTKTEALGKAILAYTQGGNPQPFIQASDVLLAAIKAADTQVAGSLPLTVEEATGIANGVLGLNATVAKVIDDLISKKSAFAADNQAAAVYQSLLDQKEASVHFSDTVTGKTPDDIKPIASELSKGIVDSLNKGIAAFQGSGPPPGSSPPPGSTTSKPGSSTPPSSSPTKSTSSGGLPTVSKPTKPTESPEPPCDSGPPPAGPPYPTKPPHPPYTPPSVPGTPAEPAVPNTPIPPPAQYTAAAARVGASMFALGVAAVGLVM